MNSVKLREWLEIIGILAVVASLVFVGIEIRQTSRAALEESFVGDLGTMIALEEIVVENSDVWLRGCRAEELNDVERVQFTRMYHMHEFLFFMRWLQRRSDDRQHGLEPVSQQGTAAGMGSAWCLAAARTRPHAIPALARAGRSSGGRISRVRTRADRKRLSLWTQLVRSENTAGCLVGRPLWNSTRSPGRALQLKRTFKRGQVAAKNPQ
jgi:hypothetical protein